MDRVTVVGASGAGKSTVARALADREGLTHIELDSMYHRPDWQPTPTPEFRSELLAVLAETERWIIDGNYQMVRDIVHARADTIVWLDLGRWRVTSRVARRSARRVIRREELWGTNREHWRDVLSLDGTRSPVVWTWQHHDRYREMYEGLLDGGTWDHAVVHRLTTPGEVRAFVATADV